MVHKAVLKLISVTTHICSLVKTSAVHKLTCLYGSTENVQKRSYNFNGAEEVLTSLTSLNGMRYGC